MNQPGGVFAAPHRAVTLGILLTLTAVATQGMAVATILPSVASDLGGFDGYGWAFSAFMLASLLGAIGAGQVADRGRLYAPAAVGFACFTLGLVVASAASAWTLLLLARCIQGFGAGCVGAIAYVAVARAYPEALRPRLMALLSSAWIVPSLVGPALAGQVTERFSWRLVFIGIVPVVLLGAWMLLPTLARVRPQSEPVTRSTQGAGSRPLGSTSSPGRLSAGLRLTAGVALVLFAAGLPTLAAAVVLAAVGLALAAPALRALLPIGTLRASHGAPAAVAMRGLVAFGFFGAEALIPLGLSTQRGLSASLVGLALTVGALAWVAGSWVQDRAEAASEGSLPHRAVRAASGLVLILVGIASVLWTMASPRVPVGLAVVAWALAGLGMGLTYPAATLTALGNAADGEEGSIASSLQVAETIGIAAGAGLVGVLLSLAEHLGRGMADGEAWGFVVAAIAVAAAVVPAIRLAPRWPPGSVAGVQAATGAVTSFRRPDLTS